MAKLTPKERGDHAQKFELRFHNPARCSRDRRPASREKHWAETEKSEDAREARAGLTRAARSPGPRRWSGLKGLLEEEMDERLVEAIIDAVAAARQGKRP